ncbi:hypothetical protein D3C80_2210750 [compost metagenome]
MLSASDGYIDTPKLYSNNIFVLSITIGFLNASLIESSIFAISSVVSTLVKIIANSSPPNL